MIVVPTEAYPLQWPVGVRRARHPRQSNFGVHAIGEGAIALSIGAMRGMDRWGAVSIEQAFAGFAALPPGSGEEIIPEQPRIEINWREVLGGFWPSDLSADETFAIAKARHRKQMETDHPDHGGAVERATQLNLAIAAAEQELKP